jgi:hypothetical protein
MHETAISPQQRRALQALTPVGHHGFYLAGGTGLCLHLAHRRSIDIDLFRSVDFDPEQLLSELRAEGVEPQNVRSQRSTLWFDIEGIETSLMSFRYPTLSAPESALGVPVASLADIAAMKIEAITSRGARKDFVDLYFICRESDFGLSGALSAFERRFASAQPDLLHRVRALTFFEDAEQEPDLLMLRPVEWADVRDYFEREARAWWQTAGR